MPTEIPTFDMTAFLEGDESLDIATQMAEYMHQTGIVVIKDPRVSVDDNAEFTQLMQA